MASIPLNQPARCGGPIPVLTQGFGTFPGFSISCSTIMSATPLKCLEAVLNTAEYPSWNTSWPRVTITHSPSPEGVNLEAAELQRVVGLPGYLYAGIKMTSEVHKIPGDGSPTMAKLEVSVMERFEKAGRTGYRVAWKGVGIPFFLFHMERVQEFVETEIEGKVVTEYYCWETFGGLLSYAVRWLMGQQLEKAFMRWMEELKSVAEKIS
ncbi:hypothetical protein BKA56DRAFT_620784 [Ilyonectria sp. MPI-CAGE-AT-0026]|nr:hypothetical protein BKA56DRAFT_620784 [Ilyonectria sp. MPI-CAGE-AT-0026]